MSELDFYAKIESFLEQDAAKRKLYEIFLKAIKNLEFHGSNALDFGCGSGEFALSLSRNFKVTCLDKSKEMVEICKKKGLKALNLELSEVKDSFDLITASFDVLNYMDRDELKDFLKTVPKKLKNGGYFIFDINSFFGFDGVANGVLHEILGKDHLVIDASFDGEILKTDMILFSRHDGDHYKKFKSSITQYYHDFEFIRDNLELNFIKKDEIYLYECEESDKILAIFQKSI